MSTEYGDRMVDNLSSVEQDTITKYVDMCTFAAKKELGGFLKQKTGSVEDMKYLAKEQIDTIIDTLVEDETVKGIVSQKVYAGLFKNAANWYPSIGEYAIVIGPEGWFEPGDIVQVIDLPSSGLDGYDDNAAVYRSGGKEAVRVRAVNCNKATPGYESSFYIHDLEAVGAETLNGLGLGIEASKRKTAFQEGDRVKATKQFTGGGNGTLEFTVYPGDFGYVMNNGSDNILVSFEKVGGGTCMVLPDEITLAGSTAGVFGEAAIDCTGNEVFIGDMVDYDGDIAKVTGVSIDGYLTLWFEEENSPQGGVDPERVTKISNKKQAGLQVGERYYVDQLADDVTIDIINEVEDKVLIVIDGGGSMSWNLSMFIKDIKDGYIHKNASKKQAGSWIPNIGDQVVLTSGIYSPMGGQIGQAYTVDEVGLSGGNYVWLRGNGIDPNQMVSIDDIEPYGVYASKKQASTFAYTVKHLINKVNPDRDIFFDIESDNYDNTYYVMIYEMIGDEEVEDTDDGGTFDYEDMAMDYINEAFNKYLATGEWVEGQV